MNRRMLIEAALSTVEGWSGRLHEMQNQRFGWPPTGKGRRERSALRTLADVEGALSNDELRWLYRRLEALADDAAVIEVGAGAGQSTICIAQAFKGTHRRLYSLWSSAVADVASGAAEGFWAWHQNVIRKYAVPYVVPVLVDDEARCMPPLPDDAALFFAGPGSRLGAASASVANFATRTEVVVAIERSAWIDELPALAHSAGNLRWDTSRGAR